MSQQFNDSHKKFVTYRQDGKCGNCQKDLAEEIDIAFHHILNQKDGGAGIIENCVMLCGQCHLHVHNENFQQSVLVYRQQFKYANWERNSEYKGRKKGKSVEETKAILKLYDKQYERMIMNDNYDNQLRMLGDFEQNLLTLKRTIQDLRDKYKRQIDVMESAGFFEDYIAPLRERYQTFSSKIDQLESLIAQHNSKIELQQEALTTLRAMARGN